MQVMDGDVPLCLRCLRPAPAVHYYCPHCGEATGQLTPYLPFVRIKFEMDFVGTWWNRATGPGLAWPRRVAMLLVLALDMPAAIVLGLVAWPWRATRRRRGTGRSTPRA
jgi:hypothetical protein